MVLISVFMSSILIRSVENGIRKNQSNLFFVTTAIGQIKLSNFSVVLEIIRTEVTRIRRCCFDKLQILREFVFNYNTVFLTSDFFKCLLIITVLFDFYWRSRPGQLQTIQRNPRNRS